MLPPHAASGWVDRKGLQLRPRPGEALLSRGCPPHKRSLLGREATARVAHPRAEAKVVRSAPIQGGCSSRSRPA